MRLASGGFCCNPYVSEYLWVVVAVPGCEAGLIMSQHQHKLNNIFSVRSTPRHSDHDPHPGTRISHANRAECAPPTTPRLSCQASVSPLQLRPLEFRRRAWPPALPPPTPDAQHPTSMRKHNAQPHPATDTPSHCHPHTITRRPEYVPPCAEQRCKGSTGCHPQPSRSPGASCRVSDTPPRAAATATRCEAIDRPPACTPQPHVRPTHRLVPPTRRGCE